MTASASQPRPAPSPAGRKGGYPLALLLAALAGAVDAVGYVHWHGLFVSFMSGNSTTLAAAAAGGDWRPAAVSASVIGGFVAGAAVGEVLAGVAGARARATVLMAEAVLLGAGAGAAVLGLDEIAVAPILSVAMGIQNASVHRAGGIGVTLTYVTGTLVHIGRSIAEALRGAGPWSAALPYLGLWGALVGGSVVGALVAFRSETAALAGAAGTALLLAAATSAMGTDEPLDEAGRP